ncbi:MAG: alpha/beta fold hydrolase, partial [Bacteroidales bacterium]|nr:alpha/beta fold hydrolase [Bacteroidales bacterium]
MKKYLVAVLILVFSFSSLALKPEKKYVVKPENISLIYKELNAKTSDGINIKIWFIPAQDSVTKEVQRANYKNPIKREYCVLDSIPRPTIIICDGDAGSMAYNIYAARKYAINGYNVALFDWRGFGESDDFEMNQDYLFYSEFLLDYEAVINTVNHLPETKKDQIGLFGFSTGAYFSFAAAYQNP